MHAYSWMSIAEFNMGWDLTKKNKENIEERFKLPEF